MHKMLKFFGTKPCACRKRSQSSTNQKQQITYSSKGFPWVKNMQKSVAKKDVGRMFIVISECFTDSSWTCTLAYGDIAFQ